MAASYPAGLPSFDIHADGVDYVMAADVNDQGVEIVALATELGINVAGSMTNLVTRLAVVLDNDGTLKLSGITEHTGIADNNIVEVDGSPADNEYSKWTAAGLEGRSYAEMLTDLSIVFGIADTNVLKVDGSVVLNDFLLATSGGVKGKTYGQVVVLIDGASDWDFADHDLHNMKQVDFQDEHNSGNATGTAILNFNNGNNHKSTLTGACTYTFTAPAGPCHVQVKLVAGGTFAPTWPATVKWAGGIEPTWSTGTDIIGFWYDGTSYYGVASLGFA